MFYLNSKFSRIYGDIAINAIFGFWTNYSQRFELPDFMMSMYLTFDTGETHLSPEGVSTSIIMKDLESGGVT